MVDVSLLGIDTGICPTIDELEQAARKFATMGGADAWERGIAIAQRIVRGEAVSLLHFGQSFRSGYLNRWRSRFPAKSDGALLKAMRGCRDSLHQLPDHLLTLEVKHLRPVSQAFGRIVAVHGVSGTTASKTLSAVRPGLFVMWDESIACRYGFARNPGGGVLPLSVAHGLHGPAALREDGRATDACGGEENRGARR